MNGDTFVRCHACNRWHAWHACPLTDCIQPDTGALTDEVSKGVASFASFGVGVFVGFVGALILAEIVSPPKRATH